MARANAHERVVEEIVREVLDLDTSGPSREDGDLMGTQREAVEDTFKRHLTLEEMAAEFRQAVSIIEGFCVASEEIGPVMLALMGDSKRRAEEAYRRAKHALEA